jgi:hypothetical protein
MVYQEMQIGATGAPPIGVRPAKLQNSATTLRINFLRGQSFAVLQA